MTNTMMQLPPYVQPGDLVGITAPARWVDPEDIRNFLSFLEGEGLKTLTGDIHARYHQFAGKDKDRLKDLQQMLDHPDIRVIFCARGGYGTLRLLDKIDLRGMAQHPKWVVGFSDITVLHACLQMRIGMASIHGAMPYTLREATGAEDLAVSSLFGILKGELPSYTAPAHPLNREGSCTGVLLGGNLSVLYSLTGTLFQFPTRGAVLFLEDVDEYLYHIDRMMQNLKLAGMLENLAGLVVGGMSDMHDNEVPFGMDAAGIIRAAVEEYSFPVCFYFPAGHVEGNMSMVLGRSINLEVNRDGSRMAYVD
jgi:muramoyltetrapeptide carboxypeptidase